MYYDRFRQEYRFERKKSTTEKSFALWTPVPDSLSSSSSSSKRHHIHRVVVLHQNVKHTFVEASPMKNMPKKDEDCSNPFGEEMPLHHLSTAAAMATTSSYDVDAVTTTTATTVTDTSSVATTFGIDTHTNCTFAYQDFFDCDSFWSGQITWY